MKTHSRWNSPAARASLGLTLACAMFVVSLPAQALDVAGVSYQPVAQVGNSPLHLNGAGTPLQAASGVYSAGLYLEQPTHAAQAVLGKAGGKQVRLVMLRDTSARQLTELLSQGLVDNTSNDMLADLVSEIFDVGLLLNAHGVFHAGDTLQIDAHPVTGTTITLGSGARAQPASQSFANPNLFPALMGVWLGEHPVDAHLKQALLGTAI